MKNLMILLMLTCFSSYAQNDTLNVSITTFLKNGNAKFDQQDYSGAITEYDKLLKLDNEKEEALYKRGYAKYKV